MLRFILKMWHQYAEPFHDWSKVRTHPLVFDIIHYLRLYKNVQIYIFVYIYTIDWHGKHLSAWQAYAGITFSCFCVLFFLTQIFLLTSVHYKLLLLGEGEIVYSDFINKIQIDYEISSNYIKIQNNNISFISYLILISWILYIYHYAAFFSPFFNKIWRQCLSNADSKPE